MGTQGICGYPWIPWVTLESMGTHRTVEMTGTLALGVDRCGSAQELKTTITQDESESNTEIALDITYVRLCRNAEPLTLTFCCAATISDSRAPK